MDRRREREDGGGSKPGSVGGGADAGAAHPGALPRVRSSEELLSLFGFDLASAAGASPPPSSPCPSPGVGAGGGGGGGGGGGWGAVRSAAADGKLRSRDGNRPDEAGAGNEGDENPIGRFFGGLFGGGGKKKRLPPHAHPAIGRDSSSRTAATAPASVASASAASASVASASVASGSEGDAAGDGGGGAAAAALAFGAREEDGDDDDRGGVPAEVLSRVASEAESESESEDDDGERGAASSSSGSAASADEVSDLGGAVPADADGTEGGGDEDGLRVRGEAAAMATEAADRGGSPHPSGGERDRFYEDRLLGEGDGAAAVAAAAPLEGGDGATPTGGDVAEDARSEEVAEDVHPADVDDADDGWVEVAAASGHPPVSDGVPPSAVVPEGGGSDGGVDVAAGEGHVDEVGGERGESRAESGESVPPMRGGDDPTDGISTAAPGAAHDAAEGEGEGGGDSIAAAVEGAAVPDRSGGGALCIASDEDGGDGPAEAKAADSADVDRGKEGGDGDGRGVPGERDEAGAGEGFVGDADGRRALQAVARESISQVQTRDDSAEVAMTTRDTASEDVAQVGEGGGDAIAAVEGAATHDQSRGDAVRVASEEGGGDGPVGAKAAEGGAEATAGCPLESDGVRPSTAAATVDDGPDREPAVSADAEKGEDRDGDGRDKRDEAGAGEGSVDDVDGEREFRPVARESVSQVQSRDDSAEVATMTLDTASEAVAQGEEGGGDAIAAVEGAVVPDQSRGDAPCVASEEDGGDGPVEATAAGGGAEAKADRPPESGDAVPPPAAAAAGGSDREPAVPADVDRAEKGEDGDCRHVPGERVEDEDDAAAGEGSVDNVGGGRSAPRPAARESAEAAGTRPDTASEDAAHDNAGPPSSAAAEGPPAAVTAVEGKGYDREGAAAADADRSGEGEVGENRDLSGRRDEATPASAMISAGDEERIPPFGGSKDGAGVGEEAADVAVPTRSIKDNDGTAGDRLLANDDNDSSADHATSGEGDKTAAICLPVTKDASPLMATLASPDGEGGASDAHMAAGGHGEDTAFVASPEEEPLSSPGSGEGATAAAAADEVSDQEGPAPADADQVKRGKAEVSCDDEAAAVATATMTADEESPPLSSHRSEDGSVASEEAASKAASARNTEGKDQFAKECLLTCDGGTGSIDRAADGEGYGTVAVPSERRDADKATAVFPQATEDAMSLEGRKTAAVRLGVTEDMAPSMAADVGPDGEGRFTDDGSADRAISREGDGTAPSEGEDEEEGGVAVGAEPESKGDSKDADLAASEDAAIATSDEEEPPPPSCGGSDDGAKDLPSQSDPLPMVAGAEVAVPPPASNDLGPPPAAATAVEGKGSDLVEAVDADANQSKEGEAWDGRGISDHSHEATLAMAKISADDEEPPLPFPGSKDDAGAGEEAADEATSAGGTKNNDGTAGDRLLTNDDDNGGADRAISGEGDGTAATPSEGRNANKTVAICLPVIEEVTPLMVACASPDGEGRAGDTFVAAGGRGEATAFAAGPGEEPPSSPSSGEGATAAGAEDEVADQEGAVPTDADKTKEGKAEDSCDVSSHRDEAVAAATAMMTADEEGPPEDGAGASEEVADKAALAKNTEGEDRFAEDCLLTGDGGTGSIEHADDGEGDVTVATSSEESNAEMTAAIRLQVTEDAAPSMAADISPNREEGLTDDSGADRAIGLEGDGAAAPSEGGDGAATTGGDVAEDMCTKEAGSVAVDAEPDSEGESKDSHLAASEDSAIAGSNEEEPPPPSCWRLDGGAEDLSSSSDSLPSAVGTEVAVLPPASNDLGLPPAAVAVIEGIGKGSNSEEAVDVNANQRKEGEAREGRDMSDHHNKDEAALAMAKISAGDEEPPRLFCRPEDDSGADEEAANEAASMVGIKDNDGTAGDRLLTNDDDDCGLICAVSGKEDGAVVLLSEGNETGKTVAICLPVTKDASPLTATCTSLDGNGEAKDTLVVASGGSKAAAFAASPEKESLSSHCSGEGATAAAAADKVSDQEGPAPADADQIKRGKAEDSCDVSSDNDGIEGDCLVANDENDAVSMEGGGDSAAPLEIGDAGKNAAICPPATEDASLPTNAFASPDGEGGAGDTSTAAGGHGEAASFAASPEEKSLLSPDSSEGATVDEVSSQEGAAPADADQTKKGGAEDSRYVCSERHKAAAPLTKAVDEEGPPPPSHRFEEGAAGPARNTEGKDRFAVDRLLTGNGSAGGVDCAAEGEGDGAVATSLEGKGAEKTAAVLLQVTEDALPSMAAVISLDREGGLTNDNDADCTASWEGDISAGDVAEDVGSEKEVGVAVDTEPDSEFRTKDAQLAASEDAAITVSDEEETSPPSLGCLDSTAKDLPSSAGTDPPLVSNDVGPPSSAAAIIEGKGSDCERAINADANQSKESKAGEGHDISGQRDEASMAAATTISAFPGSENGVSVSEEAVDKVDNDGTAGNGLLTNDYGVGGLVHAVSGEGDSTIASLSEERDASETTAIRLLASEDALPSTAADISPDGGGGLTNDSGAGRTIVREGDNAPSEREDGAAATGGDVAGDVGSEEKGGVAAGSDPDSEFGTKDAHLAEGEGATVTASDNKDPPPPSHRHADGAAQDLTEGFTPEESDEVEIAGDCLAGGDDCGRAVLGEEGGGASALEGPDGEEVAGLDNAAIAVADDPLNVSSDDAASGLAGDSLHGEVGWPEGKDQETSADDLEDGTGDNVVPTPDGTEQEGDLLEPGGTTDGADARAGAFEEKGVISNEGANEAEATPHNSPKEDAGSDEDEKDYGVLVLALPRHTPEAGAESEEKGENDNAIDDDATAVAEAKGDVSGGTPLSLTVSKEGSFPEADNDEGGNLAAEPTKEKCTIPAVLATVAGGTQTASNSNLAEFTPSTEEAAGRYTTAAFSDESGVSAEGGEGGAPAPSSAALAGEHPCAGAEEAGVAAGSDGESKEEEGEVLAVSGRDDSGEVLTPPLSAPEAGSREEERSESNGAVKEGTDHTPDDTPCVKMAPLDPWPSFNPDSDIGATAIAEPAEEGGIVATAESGGSDDGCGGSRVDEPIGNQVATGGAIPGGEAMAVATGQGEESVSGSQVTSGEVEEATSAFGDDGKNGDGIDAKTSEGDAKGDKKYLGCEAESGPTAESAQSQPNALDCKLREETWTQVEVAEKEETAEDHASACKTVPAAGNAVDSGALLQQTSVVADASRPENVPVHDACTQRNSSAKGDDESKVETMESSAGVYDGEASDWVYCGKARAWVYSSESKHGTKTPEEEEGTMIPNNPNETLELSTGKEPEKNPEVSMRHDQPGEFCGRTDTAPSKDCLISDAAPQTTEATASAEKDDREQEFGTVETAKAKNGEKDELGAWVYSEKYGGWIYGDQDGNDDKNGNVYGSDPIAKGNGENFQVKDGDKDESGLWMRCEKYGGWIHADQNGSDGDENSCKTNSTGAKEEKTALLKDTVDNSSSAEISAREGSDRELDGPLTGNKEEGEMETTPLESNQGTPTEEQSPRKTQISSAEKMCSSPHFSNKGEIEPAPIQKDLALLGKEGYSSGTYRRIKFFSFFTCFALLAVLLLTSIKIHPKPVEQVPAGSYDSIHDTSPISAPEMHTDDSLPTSQMALHSAIDTDEESERIQTTVSPFISGAPDVSIEEKSIQKQGPKSPVGGRGGESSVMKTGKEKEVQESTEIAQVKGIDEMEASQNAVYKAGSIEMTTTAASSKAAVEGIKTAAKGQQVSQSKAGNQIQLTVGMPPVGFDGVNRTEIAQVKGIGEKEASQNAVHKAGDMEMNMTAASSAAASEGIKTEAKGQQGSQNKARNQTQLIAGVSPVGFDGVNHQSSQKQSPVRGTDNFEWRGIKEQSRNEKNFDGTASNGWPSFGTGIWGLGPTPAFVMKNGYDHVPNQQGSDVIKSIIDLRCSEIQASRVIETWEARYFMKNYEGKFVAEQKTNQAIQYFSEKTTRHHDSLPL